MGDRDITSNCIEMWRNEHELKPIGDKFKGGKIILQMFLQKEEQDANLAI